MSCSREPIEVLRDRKYGEGVRVGDSPELTPAIVSTLRDWPLKSMLRDRAWEFSVATIADEYERVLFPSLRYADARSKLDCSLTNIQNNTFVR